MGNSVERLSYSVEPFRTSPQLHTVTQVIPIAIASVSAGGRLSVPIGFMLWAVFRDRNFWLAKQRAKMRQSAVALFGRISAIATFGLMIDWETELQAIPSLR